MEFRVLGRLEVTGDDGAVVAIDGADARALLLMLLLNANEVVPLWRLVEAAGTEGAPATAAGVLQERLSHLGVALDRGRGEAVPRLAAVGDGYLLRTAPGEVDRERFEALLVEARGEAEPVESLALYRAALALWRGAPLVELARHELARNEVARLEKLWLAATEARIDLELQSGCHEAVLEELRALTAAHPFRQELHRQLMLALYRAGREAEALAAFGELRRGLAQEFGVEPDATLRQLELAIFRRDVPPLREASRPLPAPAGLGRGDPSDLRKTVTVVFTDLVDSSRLSLALDPEALRSLLARYFGGLSTIVERHGGIVEKYIGDAIMAVFGVPAIHEDDALRAVRAAVEMRDALVELNRGIEATWGVRLAGRIGVNTGEVIAGDHRQGDFLVTGRAVMEAKRLEEAAVADEVLIGKPTYGLVRDAVLVEPSGPRRLKQGGTVDAYVVLGVLAQATGRARRFDLPFIGREDQRAALEGAFRSVVRNGTCEMITVFGNAGVGKSRLVREFTAGLPPGTTVVRGRCLPYGEGITYWPLAEIVREITDSDGAGEDWEPAVAIARWLQGDAKAALIAERIADAIGVGSGRSGTSEETFWAVRRLLEALARTGPLVVLLDDLHWAEPTFLDLIGHLTDVSRGAPILLVGIARPELLETRPGWSTGKSNAAAIHLGPLSDGECGALIANLLGGAALPPGAAARIARAAAGNALFAEEFVAMLVDDALLTRQGDRWVSKSDLSAMPMPATINALLAARIEGLPVNEQAILRIAAVEGEVFHRRAIADLAAAVRDVSVETGLAGLLRRDLIRRESVPSSGEEAYRFRHILIRDAAYRSLPKNTRADLHERFAGWLETPAAERLRGLEEIVGYHLEQAFLYRAALGARDAHAAGLATRAAALLDTAGRRALVRSDLPAAIGLLERVSELLVPGDPRRAAVMAEIGGAMTESGRLAEAAHALEEAAQHAATARDERAASHVLVQRQFLRLLHVEDGGLEEAERVAREAIAVFGRAGDDLGLCRARRLQAWLRWNEARALAAAEAWELAAGHAERAGDRHEHDEIMTWIASSLWFGPTPTGDAIRRCEAIRDRVRESPEAEAATLRHLASLHAMVGRFDLARTLLATSNATYADLGLSLSAATSQNEAVVELLAGDPAAAETSLRVGYDALEAMGERAYRSTTAALLAQAMFEQGREGEAERLAAESAALADAGDLLTQVLWRRVQARVLARRAPGGEAEALAREAVAIAAATDFLNCRADATLDLAAVLDASGRRCEAAEAGAEALALYELKGNAVSAAAVRLRLADFAPM